MENVVNAPSPRVQQDPIAAHLRSDGKVAIRSRQTGATALVWPIDAREAFNSGNVTLVEFGESLATVAPLKPFTAKGGVNLAEVPRAPAAADPVVNSPVVNAAGASAKPAVISPRNLQAPPARMPGAPAFKKPAPGALPVAPASEHPTPPPSMSPFTAGAPPPPDGSSPPSGDDEI